MVFVGYLVYSVGWYCPSVYLGDANRGELRMIKLIKTDNLTIQFDQEHQNVMISTRTQDLSLPLNGWIELRMIIEMLNNDGG